MFCNKVENLKLAMKCKADVCECVFIDVLQNKSCHSEVNNLMHLIQSHIRLGCCAAE
jgi:hypothetical protein